MRVKRGIECEAMVRAGLVFRMAWCVYHNHFAYNQPSTWSAARMQLKDTNVQSAFSGGSINDEGVKVWRMQSRLFIKGRSWAERASRCGYHSL